MKETKKTILSQQNAFAFLVYLYRAGGSAKASYLQEVIPNYASIKSIGSQLEEDGLIITTVTTGKNGHILYELTEKGRKIATHLNNAYAEYVSEDDKSETIESEEDYVKDHKESISNPLNIDQKDYFQ